jgi:hypothetical protein
MIHTRLIGLAALGSAGLLAAACGPAVLDDGKLQDAIASGFAQQTQVEVKSVDCPDDQKIATNATFNCTLTAADGTTYTIAVTQTDDKGNVHWSVVQPEGSPGASPEASPAAS